MKSLLTLSKSKIAPTKNINLFSKKKVSNNRHLLHQFKSHNTNNLPSQNHYIKNISFSGQAQLTKTFQQYSAKSYSSFKTVRANQFNRPQNLIQKTNTQVHFTKQNQQFHLTKQNQPSLTVKKHFSSLTSHSRSYHPSKVAPFKPEKLSRRYTSMGNNFVAAAPEDPKEIDESSEDNMTETEYLLTKAMEYYMDGDSASGIDTLNKVIDNGLTPEDIEKGITLPRVLNNKALMLFSQGKVEQTFEIFQKVIENDPDDWHAYYHQAVIYYELDEIYESMANIKRAISLRDDFGPAYTLLGDLCCVNSWLEESLENYQKATTLLIPKMNAPEYDPLISQLIEVPKDIPRQAAEAWAGIGSIYGCYMNKFEEGHKYLDESIKIDPTFGDSYFYKSNIYLADDQAEAALECINKAIECDPSDSHFYSNKAAVLNYLKKHQEALKFSLISLSLEKDDFLAWANVGYAHEGLGQPNSAAKAFFKAHSIQPGDEVIKKKAEKYKISAKLRNPDFEENSKIPDPERESDRFYQQILKKDKQDMLEKISQLEDD